MKEAPAKRRFPLVAVGLLLLLVAALLVALVAVPRPKKDIDAGSEARIACRDFEDVYAATKPGTPMNGQELATELERAIGHMHEAASADAKYKALASALDDVGTAVNAGDASGSYGAMKDVDARCAPVLNPATGTA